MRKMHLKLKVFISKNRKGPFDELPGCLCVPSAVENDVAFLALSSEQFRQAWNNVLSGGTNAMAFFRFKGFGARKEFEAMIYPLYADTDNQMVGPVGYWREVR